MRNCATYLISFTASTPEAEGQADEAIVRCRGRQDGRGKELSPQVGSPRESPRKRATAAGDLETHSSVDSPAGKGRGRRRDLGVGEQTSACPQESASDRRAFALAGAHLMRRDMRGYFVCEVGWRRLL